MKLRPKLLLFALVAIIVPIMGIALFAGVFVYRSGVISEREMLEEVALEISNNVMEIQERYSRALSRLAVEDYVRSKLYVYSKYWDQIDSSTLQIDIIPLKNEIEKFSLTRQLESVAVYRRGYDKYVQVAVVGRATNIPDVIYFESVSKYLNQTYFYLYSDGIYLNAIAPVYVSDNEIGLVLLQKSFDTNFFSMLSLQYGVRFALYTRGRFLFSSLPDIQELPAGNSSEPDTLTHSSYRSQGQDYNIVLYNFDIGNGVTGTLLVGAPKSSFFRNRQLTVLLSIITMFCILIPVLTFYLWGIDLIGGIRQLVSATRAVSRGDYGHQIGVGRSDELGSLASAFNSMTLTLKENHERLETSNRELTLLNSYIDAVFQSLLLTTLVIDRQYNLVLANQSAQSSLNLPEPAGGLAFFSIPFFSEHRDQITAKLEDVFRDGQPEHIARLETGCKSYSLDFFPVGDGSKDITGTVVVIVDITEHLNMERAVVQSEKLAEIGKLAAGIAHEIGNPMGVILNHVQLIATGQLSAQEQREYITRIESEVRRINSLVEKLLHISRDESAEMREVALAALAKEIVELFSPKLKQRRIEARIRLKGEDTRVTGNPDSLKQVFFNVLNNAIQSIDHDHGRIRLSIHSAEDRVRVDVEDNGKGMEKAIIERLFDPFVTNKNSTGLGLFLSSKIMKRHGGTISVSAGRRNGTVVTLEFPKGGEIGLQRQL